VTVGVVLLLAGLALLVGSADQFVRGAAQGAEAAHLPPVVVGAVVVGFGTSLPEGVVSVLAALQDEPGLAVGNLIGSNAANLGLVLGVGAAVAAVPVVVGSATLRREAPLSMAACLLFSALVLLGLPRWSATVLLAAAAAAVWVVLTGPRVREAELTREVEEFVEPPQPLEPARVNWPWLRTLVGLAGTLVGAQAIVLGATGLAEELGLAEGLVGLALVAVGTSLPELATGVAAVRRGEDELLVGNVLGSNLFNSLVVAALVAVAGGGLVVDDVIRRGVVLLVVLVGLGWAVMGRRLRVSRREGVLLLVAYAVGLAWLAG
jgi:cation:H+ antiporter